LQAVILAGGLGTRLRPLTLDLPKPMIPVAGRPFLDYELQHLKKNGFHNFVLCVGYKAEVIESYFGDGMKKGLSIAYSRDGEKQRGPAGALKRAGDLLEKEFMVTYADSFLQLDYSKFEETFHASGKLGTMAVLENQNLFGKSDVAVKGGMVVRYDKTHHSEDLSWINYGATMLQKKALDLIPVLGEVGEEKFYGSLIERSELAAFPAFRRFYEIGSLPGLQEFEKFVSENPRLFGS
jgi:N-acetyl-alpha-D-muramate 1-phosphate uridylyltransferase